MRPSLSRTLLPSLLLPLAALGGCGQDGPPPLPPVPEEAMAAVATEPGVPRESLARAVDRLFAEEGAGETRALLVLHDGDIVAERYSENVDADTRQVGWSMSKTVTAVLVGMLVADGRLALDRPAPIPRWQRSGDPRGEITLRHLLQMRSGLRHQEKADPVYESPEVRMMYLDGRDDMAGWAEAQPLDHEPGTHFQYSTNSTVILADIATSELAPGGAPRQRQQAMAEFLEARLGTPLGMDSLVAEYDADGTMIGGSAVWATARDWAKFGEFLRNGGRAGGVQVLPRSWVQFMREPSPAASDYGGLTWLNRDSGVEDRTVLSPGKMPDDAFAAVGHLGQYVLVSPSQKLTVVRLGKTDEEMRGELVERLADIVALYPGR